MHSNYPHIEFIRRLVRGSHGAAGLDAILAKDIEIYPGTLYSTNLVFDRPCSVQPRSGLAFKCGLDIPEQWRYKPIGCDCRAKGHLLCSENTSILSFVVHQKDILTPGKPRTPASLEQNPLCFKKGTALCQVIFDHIIPQKTSNLKFKHVAVIGYPTMRDIGGFGSTDTLSGIPEVAVLRSSYPASGPLYELGFHSKYTLRCMDNGDILVYPKKDLRVEPGCLLQDNLELTLALPFGTYIRVTCSSAENHALAGIVDADYRGSINYKIRLGDNVTTIQRDQPLLHLKMCTYDSKATGFKR